MTKDTDKHRRPTGWITKRTKQLDFKKAASALDDVGLTSDKLQRWLASINRNLRAIGLPEIGRFVEVLPKNKWKYVFGNERKKGAYCQAHFFIKETEKNFSNAYILADLGNIVWILMQAIEKNKTNLAVSLGYDLGYKMALYKIDLEQGSNILKKIKSLKDASIGGRERVKLFAKRDAYIIKEMNKLLANNLSIRSASKILSGKLAKSQKGDQPRITLRPSSIESIWRRKK